MDSLLANYASSDEEHEEQTSSQAKPRKSESKAGEEKVEDFLPKSSLRSSSFDSLPQPKSSLFTSLPPPKSQPFPNPKPQSGNKRDDQVAENSKPKSSSTSLFSALPPPKSSSSSSTKRIVQFRPPTITNPYSASLDDEDEDEDEGEEERKRKRSKESISTATPASFLSSIPAPRHSATLGALPAASGRNRRSVLETEAASSDISPVNETGSDEFTNPNLNYSNNQSNDTNYAYSSWGSGGENHAYYSGNGAVPNVDAGTNSNASHFGDQTHDHSSSLGGENYAYYGAYPTDINSVGAAGSISAGTDSNTASYEAADYSYTYGQHVEYADHSGNTQYEDNWANAAPAPEVSGVVETALSALGQRGRKDIPPEMIVEVKQDELLKNRPREDQVKSTGIAFGPAYQPTSTKGKPTKLHKRKHQIGSLFFEMKQKESELAERRSKGFLTKAQTQAKYGW